MVRIARVMAPGVPHHIIQRGNRRLETFFSEADYREYLPVIAGLQNDVLAKDSNWSWAIAMGRQVFVTEIQQQLASRSLKRSLVPVRDDIIALKEPEVSYNSGFGAKKHVLSSDNTYFWGTTV